MLGLIVEDDYRILNTTLLGKMLLATGSLTILLFLVSAGFMPSNAYSGTPSTSSLHYPSAVTTWAKSYGGPGADVASAVQQTSDGGYIAVGTTKSFGAGSSDAWVLKLNSTGDIQWQTSYGKGGSDGANSVQQTSDGGYIVAGFTHSFGAVGFDGWVLKLSSTGAAQWQKRFGGSQDDVFKSIMQTSDGGYIVAGRTDSFGASGGHDDIWVLKITSTGTVTWQFRYGGAQDDDANSVQPTSDGGYIVAGITGSFGAGGDDAFALKLNSTGSVIWLKEYGGVNDESANSIQQTSDGGYIFAGSTTSFGAKGIDAWVVKLDSSGSAVWQKRYGGSFNEVAYSIQRTSDGGYIFGGKTNSFGHGSYDFWLVKLTSTGTISWQKTYGGAGLEVANSVQQTSDGGYVVAGYTTSFGAGLSDMWVVKLDTNGNACSLASSSSATASSTHGTTTSTTLSGVGTAATVKATLAIITATKATVTTQC